MKDVLSYRVAGEGSDQFTMAVNEARQWLRDLPPNAKVKFAIAMQTGDYALNKAQETAEEKTGDLFRNGSANGNGAGATEVVGRPMIEDSRLTFQCPRCEGAGKDDRDVPCVVCNGTGKVKASAKSDDDQGYGDKADA